MERVRGQMLEALRDISVHARKPTITEEKETTSPSAPEPRKEHSFSGASIAINPSTPPLEANTDGQQLDGPKGSSASLASSATSSQVWKSNTGSEAGAETEEDEGMVLVGRPVKK